MAEYLEKYRLLIDELKHQDQQINSTLTWNALAQGAFLTGLNLDIVQKTKVLLVIMPVVAICLCIMWILSGIRLKSYTDFYVDRISRFERETPELLNFQVYNERGPKISRAWSKVLYLFAIPGLLIAVWVIVLVAFGCRFLCG